MGWTKTAAFAFLLMIWFVGLLAGCGGPIIHSVDYSLIEPVLVLPAVNRTDRTILSNDNYYLGVFRDDTTKDLADNGYAVVLSREFGTPVFLRPSDIDELENNKEMKTISPSNYRYFIVTSFDDFKRFNLASSYKAYVTVYLVDNRTGRLVWSRQGTSRSWRGLIQGPIEAAFGWDSAEVYGSFNFAAESAIREGLSSGAVN